MAEMYSIVIDHGSTFTRAALVDNEFHIMFKIKEKSTREGNGAICRQFERMIKSILGKITHDQQKKVIGIGIASFGIIDMKGGSIIVGGTDRPLEYIPVVKLLSTKFKVPVYVLNDCIAGVIGEHEFGAGKGIDNLVYITISTGIGCGVYIDGRPIFGKDGNAHQIGHMTIDCQGKLKCSCDKYGHWEAYCSGERIPNFIRLKLKTIDENRIKSSMLYNIVEGDFSKLGSKDLFVAAKAKDDLSLEIIDEIGKFNAIGFANVINVYDPSLIIVGGTVAMMNKNLILNPIKKYIGNYVINRMPKISITKLGDDVCLYGAAAIVFNPDLSPNMTATIGEKIIRGLISLLPASIVSRLLKLFIS